MDVDENKLIRVAGLNHDLLLDDRLRIRIPDELARYLIREQGRLSGQPSAAPSDVRLGFYLAPGTRGRILLYPSLNAALATWAVEHPPAGLDPKAVRSARNFFYYHFQYVEADKFNRLLIPEQIRELTNLGRENRKVFVRGKQYYFELMDESAFGELCQVGKDDFERIGDDLLDRVNPEGAGEGQGQP
jgi:DNA-binding transcriptional regulator/RsmH inhibitor MraZ